MAAVSVRRSIVFWTFSFSPIQGWGALFLGPKTRTSPGSQNPDLTSILWPYTGRLRPKEVPFSGFRYIKGYGFH